LLRSRYWIGISRVDISRISSHPWWRYIARITITRVPIARISIARVAAIIATVIIPIVQQFVRIHPIEHTASVGESGRCA
jgi:hypothetical protein